MSPLERLARSTVLVSGLAGLTTWVTLLSWTGFAERPAGYTVPLLAACAMVAAAGALLRTARMPSMLVAATQVVVVLVWLHHRTVGVWVPTRESVGAMVAAVDAAGAAAQAYAAPVPSTVPELYLLLILAGSLTAVLVDLLAAGLRRAPLAGLPLLAAYTAPVSILDGGVSWGQFATAALCFLFLIAAQEAQRLARWGRQVTPPGQLFDTQETEVNRQGVWSAAPKIGLTTTALAVVTPLFVPTFTTTLFGGGGGTGTGDGGSVSISNPMVDLKRDLERGADIELVRVTTSDPDPSYLRISVLDSFDGGAWRPSGRDIPVQQRAKGDVLAPPGLESTVRAQEFRSTLQVTGAFRSRWLPTPYPVAWVDAPGDWRYDRSTLDFISAADGQTTAGLTYRLRSLTLRPSAVELADATAAPASVFTPNTSLPRDLPASVRRQAREVVDERASKFEQAVALQRWFRVDGGFRYSLDTSAGNGTDDLVAFLGSGPNTREGYCEQFAAAMALMGRSLGIPSRVAVGFLRPDRTGPSRFVYSTHDLHAWPEMYFGGVGWVRFEPTPQDRTGEGVPAYTTQPIPAVAPTQGSSAPGQAPSVNRVDRPENPAAAFGAEGQGPLVTRPAFLAWSGVALLAMAVVATPGTARALTRRRRWAAAVTAGDVVEAGWREVRDSAVDLGMVWDEHLTLRGAALALTRTFAEPGEEGDGRGVVRGPDADPAATAALDRLVRLVERARYSRALPDEAATEGEVRADVARCVAALRAGASRRQRLRARWLPASVTTVRSTRERSERHRAAMLTEPGVDRAV